MPHKLLVFLFLILLHGGYTHAQKIFTEGTIVYKVTLASAGQKEFTGLYTFTIKGSQIKKELKLSNGYQDIVLLNCGTSTIYSLQSRNNRKYAIQLSMNDAIKSQGKFTAFTIKNEEKNSKNISGFPADKGQINYADGSVAEVYYTKDWRPSQAITFERFPDAKFIPLYFTYTDEQGMVMTFEVKTIEAGPIENAVFRIPADYKMISYEEYKELTK